MTGHDEFMAQLQLSEEELLVQLGAALTEREQHALPVSPAENAIVGRVWLTTNYDAIAAAIRNDHRIQSVQGSRAAADAAGVFDLISDAIQHVVGDVPVHVVAMYALKRGLHVLTASRGEVQIEQPIAIPTLVICGAMSLGLVANLALWLVHKAYVVHPVLALILLSGTMPFFALAAAKVRANVDQPIS